MKYTLTLLLLTVCSLSFGQVSLKEYCPDDQSQYRATCASYAPTYTAFSIAYNKQNGYNKAHENFTVFSEGFVASKIKSDKPFTGRIFNKCGKNVIAQDALNVLKDHGTVLKKDFREGCACSKQKKLLASNTKRYKIKDWKEITSSDETTHIDNITQSLDNGSPVIITILQEPFFLDNKAREVTFPQGHEKKEAAANHVITIVGYDSAINGGSFLVKNNYTTWGDHGYAYVQYKDLLKIIRGSFVILL
ncbi:MAG: C1 family peptidase [Flavipsychrobacter sp.]